LAHQTEKNLYKSAAGRSVRAAAGARSLGRSAVKTTTIGNPALRLPETRATLAADNRWLLAIQRRVHVIGRSTFARSDR
jgi:hypothetical protein